MRTLTCATLLLALPALACNGDDTASASDSATGTTATATDATTMSTATATASASATGTATDPSGTATATGTTTTTGPTTETDPTTTDPTNPTTTNPTTTDPTTTDPTTTGTTAVTSTDPTTDPTTTTGDPPPVCGNGVVEVGEECDDGDDLDKNSCSNACTLVPCDQQEGDGMGGFDFSYIWVANSGQGTVSKINTQTLVEEGRYNTGPNAGSPSRTAVNINGRYAAVANRSSGSVTVFAADEQYCVDKNNNGMIETSTGPGNVLPWGQDECMLWHLGGLVGVTGENRGPRPLGWDFADQDPITCEYQTHNLWMGWYPNGQAGRFYYLDGTDGSILQDITVQPWGNNFNWGPYGGAVDKDHNFWVAGWHGPLLRINGQDYSTQTWGVAEMNSTSSYGMTLDRMGRPWFGGCDGRVQMFDPQTQQFTTLTDTGGCLRGLMVDAEDRAWIAGNGSCRLVEVDTIGLTVTNPNIPIPGCSTPVGISIDAEGFVWIVDQNGTAFKMDPDTYQFQMVGGLSSPYTYSDMTGAGIALQALPQ